MRIGPIPQPKEYNPTVVHQEEPPPQKEGYSTNQDEHRQQSKPLPKGRPYEIRKLDVKV